MGNWSKLATSWRPDAVNDRRQCKRMRRSSLLLLVGGFALCSSRHPHDEPEVGSGVASSANNDAAAPIIDTESMQSEKEGEQLPDGAIAGIVIGVFFFGLAIVLVARHFISAPKAKEMLSGCSDGPRSRSMDSRSGVLGIV